MRMGVYWEVLPESARAVDLRDMPIAPSRPPASVSDLLGNVKFGSTAPIVTCCDPSSESVRSVLKECLKDVRELLMLLSKA